METKTWRQGEQALRDRPRVIAESKAAEAQRQKEYRARCKRIDKVRDTLNILCGHDPATDVIKFKLFGHRYEIREVE